MPRYFNADVQLNLSIGFDATSPMDTTFTWTDVTEYVRTFDTKSGRTFELSPVSPGSAKFQLNNQDRRFDPDATAGAYAPDVTVRKPVKFAAIHNGTTYGLFYGHTDSWRPKTVGKTNEVVDLTVMDGLSLFGPWETATTGPEEAAHIRITRYLDDVDWPVGLRALDTDGNTMAAYAPNCARILSEIKRVTKTEDGLFFIDADGNATFHSHAHRTGSTAVVVFSDTDGAYHYTQPMVKTFDTKKIWNEVIVAGVAVVSQAVDSTSSVDLYGRTTLKLFDTLHPNSTSALDTATDLLDRFKTPESRVPKITIEPQSDTGMWPEVLGRGISDRINLRQATRSGVGAVWSADQHIEGVAHKGSVGGKWKTTWLLSPAT